MESRFQGISWPRAASWALATSTGFFLGLGLAAAVGLVVGMRSPAPIGGPAGAAAAGAIIAALQWFALPDRKRLVRWVLLSAVATGVGWVFGQGILWPLRMIVGFQPMVTFGVLGATMGACLGVAQARAGSSSVISRAGWILCSAVAWGIGLGLFASGGARLFRFAGVAAPGLLTGVALYVFSRSITMLSKRNAGKASADLAGESQQSSREQTGVALQKSQVSVF